MKDIDIKLERINDKWYVSNDEFLEMTIIYEEKIRRLHSIIKEVRELLKSDYFEDGSFTTEKKVFELLDKVEENK